PWGALELLVRKDTQPDPSLPGVWTVFWPFETNGVTGKLRLHIQWLGTTPFVPSLIDVRP
ncbi:MAG TPA: hypothetical protein VGR78_17455, partial [Verrucomicrobiae bacterium]|nr:hypothetical protein [Verrucomicrobiae bacterium]